MKASDLKQYRSLKREAVELENQINSHQIQETATASSLSFPYTQHTAIINGIPNTPEVKRLRYKRRSVITKYRAIEAFVDEIKDSETRRIFELYYICGRFKVSWQSVAYSIGESDESYPRRKHNRYLKNKYKQTMNEEREKPV